MGRTIRSNGPVPDVIMCLRPISSCACTRCHGVPVPDVIQRLPVSSRLRGAPHLYRTPRLPRTSQSDLVFYHHARSKRRARALLSCPDAKISPIRPNRPPRRHAPTPKPLPGSADHLPDSQLELTLRSPESPSLAQITPSYSSRTRSIRRRCLARPRNRCPRETGFPRCPCRPT